MSWLDAMKRDALAIALPDWEYQEGDTVDVDPGTYTHYDYGYGGQLYTRHVFDVTVTVWRAEVIHDDRDRAQRVYEDDAAVDFLNELMERGSA